MAKHYPSKRYHPEHAEPRTVHSAEEDAALSGWFESPADYGIETCPGRVPDPVIAAKREAYIKAKEAAQVEAPKRAPRKAKA